MMIPNLVSTAWSLHPSPRACVRVLGVFPSEQDFDQLWEFAGMEKASERALVMFKREVARLLTKHSGYRSPSEEEVRARAGAGTTRQGSFGPDTS